jgi:methylenetetrahydrofolate dehydrogenase (NADP+)/methenyltetrahydrofolate cyclohydrolase
MHHYGVEITGKNIVVMGRSPTVGYPLGMLLSQKIQWANGTVSLINASSQDPGCLLAGADIVISAVGKPAFLKGGMLKKGSTVIDMGINCDAFGRIVGDADLASMEGIVSRATPTPGGTGAVTVACMFLNLERSYLIQNGFDGSHGDPIIRMIYSDIA